MATNKARAYFMLGGYHFNPDDVTRALGIEPTRINAAGALCGLDRPVTSFWELSTETISDEIDTYKLVDLLIKQIEPIKDKLLELIKNLNLSPQICIVLTLSTDKNNTPPDVGLGARAIRFLAEIGAFINIDYQLEHA